VETRKELDMKVASLLIACSALLIGLPAASSAQTIEAGTWTGTVQPPGNEVYQVTCVVSGTKDSVAITIRQEQLGSFPARDIRVLADRITFTWSPGNDNVKCILMKKDDSSFAGDCTDAEGGTGHLVMIPPK
jgi:hypothetical protein